MIKIFRISLWGKSQEFCRFSIKVLYCFGKAATRERYPQLAPFMKNELENCTHSVPENKFGIFAMHTADNQPIGHDDLKKIIDGPIADVEKDYITAIKQPMCPTCNVELVLVPDCPTGWSSQHFACPKCDGTFNEEDFNL